MSRLTEILRFLNDTDELRETLALKGGTTINLTVFNLPSPVGRPGRGGGNDGLNLRWRVNHEVLGM